MPTPELVTPELLRQWPLPDPAGSKRARGEVLVVGGAASTPGAAALAGMASLRVGAGRVQLAVAASVAPALAAMFPEAGVLALPETPGGSVCGAAAADSLRGPVSGADAVLIGPGLDDADEAAALLSDLLNQLDNDTGLVLDAYALGAAAEHEEVGALLRDRGTQPVLTPNASELGLLMRENDQGMEDDVPEVASRYSCCISSLSTVATADGRTWRIPQGHPGLATAGSGDVLAGLVVGVLARGAEPEQAACWGTYLHSTAGERLASAVGGVGFLARELVDQIPPVLAELG